jgi:beta-lactamase superfamily II metal-dependent hydrolase
MPFQIDFLPVGDGEKSGDAICLRFGVTLTPTEQNVVVIDGGFQESGQKLVDHVKNVYGTSYVDLVISTHPDADHSSGLEMVLNQLQVGSLWLHQPWNHTDDIAKMFKDGRVTDMSVAAGIRKSLDDARALERIALKRQIPISEPFAGLVHHTSAIAVLSPTKQLYESLLPSFRCTPKAKFSFLDFLLETAKEAVGKLIEEKWHVELLPEPPKGTHAENESSAIILFEWDGQKVLFTGDAGPAALNLALHVMKAAEISPADLVLVQIPHHGSRRNVGPRILDQLLGPALAVPAFKRSAVVSASKNGAPKHPSKLVINAFTRRGCLVFNTYENGPFVWHYNAPRPGWQVAKPMPFFSQVEE